MVPKYISYTHSEESIRSFNIAFGKSKETKFDTKPLLRDQMSHKQFFNPLANYNANFLVTLFAISYSHCDFYSGL